MLEEQMAFHLEGLHMSFIISEMHRLGVVDDQLYLKFLDKQRELLTKIAESRLPKKQKEEVKPNE